MRDPMASKLKKSSYATQWYYVYVPLVKLDRSRRQLFVDILGIHVWQVLTLLNQIIYILAYISHAFSVKFKAGVH